jgi:hypothetical protein
VKFLEIQTIRNNHDLSYFAYLLKAAMLIAVLNYSIGEGKPEVTDVFSFHLW